jgi:hypothetical protein
MATNSLKRRGRRPNPKRELRNHVISVRLTDMEHRRLRAQAERAGSKELGRFLYVRFAGRVAPRIPELNIAAWSHLGKVAGGLTTMAKAAARLELPAIDRALLAELREALAGVRNQLIGVDLIPDNEVRKDGDDEHSWMEKLNER